jgi:hypothetical protein
MTQANRVVREGVVVGLIGTATVALFYAVFDALAARGLLFTPNLLGRVVFDGLRDPSVLVGPVAMEPTAIVLYSLLHLVTSLAIGLVVAWLVSQLEGPPAQARLAALLIIAGFFVTIFGIGLAMSPVKAVLPWWSVVVANVLAVVVGGAYVVRRHPGILRGLTIAR